jgi:hypothetical protein
MNRSFLLLFTVSSLLFLTSCTDDELATGGGGAILDCRGQAPTYSANIKSIMDGSCATSGCHNSSTQANGIDLSTYDLVKTESGKIRFLGSIRHESGFDRMPQGKSKLSDSTIDMIACWIENGSAE